MAGKETFENPAELFAGQLEGTAATDPEAVNIPEGYRLVRESKSKRLQLLVTPTIAENLKAIALLRKCSVNELCNRIFEEYMRKDT